MNNIAFIFGRKNSVGVKNKNILKILDRSCAEYCFIATKYSNITKTYLSTDCPEIIKIGKKYNTNLIYRPNNLATNKALLDDVIINVWNIVKKREKNINSITIMFCNCPAIDVKLLNYSINFINKNQDYDSCISISKFNMFSPYRARIIDKNNNILPYLNYDKFIKNTSCDRNSSGNVFFPDFNIQVLNKRALDNIEHGLKPQKWFGKKIKGVINDYGFDIDCEWQIPVIEKWLLDKGFTKDIIPWVKK